MFVLFVPYKILFASQSHFACEIAIQGYNRSKTDYPVFKIKSKNNAICEIIKKLMKSISKVKDVGALLYPLKKIVVLRIQTLH